MLEHDDYVAIWTSVSLTLFPCRALETATKILSTFTFQWSQLCWWHRTFHFFKVLFTHFFAQCLWNEKILVLGKLVWKFPLSISTSLSIVKSIDIENSRKTISFASAAIAIANTINYDVKMREMKFTAPLILHINFFSALNLNSKCLLHCEASINACVADNRSRSPHSATNNNFYLNVFSTFTFIFCTYFGHADTDYIHFWWDAHCFWLTFDTNTSKKIQKEKPNSKAITSVYICLADRLNAICVFHLNLFFSN